MYKIIIKGLAGETNASDISKLNGIDCQECFSDYIFDHRPGEEGHRALIEKGVSGGYMEFKYDSGNLYVEVVYTSREKLDDNDLRELISYTKGQMSDGIGENFEQEPVFYEDNGDEVYISPYFRGQVLKATQELYID